MVDLAERFKEVAEANFFEVAEFAEMLRAHPIGVGHRILLEVQRLADDPDNFKLLQHRQPDLTALYANKIVSATWIEKFFHANRDTAWFIAESEAIPSRVNAASKRQIDYDAASRPKTESDKAGEDPEVQRLRLEEEATRQKSISEANARADVAAGVDQQDPRNSYYASFLRNNGGGPYVRGRGAPTRK